VSDGRAISISSSSRSSVRVHDFAIPKLGKAVPYGIYDIADNAGWVNLGISHDTAAFRRSRASGAGGTSSAPSAIPPPRGG
jgi:hypothetical protein